MKLQVFCLFWLHGIETHLELFFGWMGGVCFQTGHVLALFLLVTGEHGWFILKLNVGHSFRFSWIYCLFNAAYYAS